MKNRVFFPQRALDLWLGKDRVDLVGNELVIRAEGRKYHVVEAIRVVKEVTGGVDLHELVGKVKSVSFMQELGAELLDTSMVLGDLAYDIVPGFAGTPIGSFAEHRAVSTPPGDGPIPCSDEEMLAQYLAGHLG
ncbi:MAG: hypothetical protein IPI67_38125 [Myxococcales bacterium]|nr:hypothetical protein [Myxococcales bacterium]